MKAFKEYNLHQRLIFIVVIAALGHACSTAPSGWQKSGAPTSDVERDQTQCSYEAKTATASYKSTPSKPGETAAMGTAVGDGIVIAEKQIDLTNECMKARGYVPK